MIIQGFEKFIDNLAKILNEPPYHLFLFIGSVFVLIALISKWNFEPVWTYFIYATIGTIWRYAERDALGVARDTKNSYLKLSSLVVYHIGNILLFLALLRYLRFI